jgi:hypothetical protein
MLADRWHSERICISDRHARFTAGESSRATEPEQLRELAAPIALYPDPLVGQILAAATYPSQVVEANQWMLQHQGLTGDALAKEVAVDGSRSVGEMVARYEVPGYLGAYRKISSDQAEHVEAAQM